MKPNVIALVMAFGFITSPSHADPAQRQLILDCEWKYPLVCLGTSTSSISTLISSDDIKAPKTKNDLVILEAPGAENK